AGRMKQFSPITMLAAMLALGTPAAAQVSPTPPAADSARKEVPKDKKAPAKKSTTPAAPKSTPTPTSVATPKPADGPFDDPNTDVVYGAYQRGQYKTAFDLAINRAQFNGDPKAMTMLGELYENGMGVKRDFAKAAEWYRRGADAGDREAMFALAMMRISGRGGATNKEEAV